MWNFYNTSMRLKVKNEKKTVEIKKKKSLMMIKRGKIARPALPFLEQSYTYTNAIATFVLFYYLFSFIYLCINKCEYIHTHYSKATTNGFIVMCVCVKIFFMIVVLAILRSKRHFSPFSKFDKFSFHLPITICGYWDQTPLQIHLKQ